MVKKISFLVNSFHFYLATAGFVQRVWKLRCCNGVRSITTQHEAPLTTATSHNVSQWLSSDTHSPHCA